MTGPYPPPSDTPNPDPTANPGPPGGYPPAPQPQYPAPSYPPPQYQQPQYQQPQYQQPQYQQPQYQQPQHPQPQYPAQPGYPGQPQYPGQAEYPGQAQYPPAGQPQPEAPTAYGQAYPANYAPVPGAAGIPGLPSGPPPKQRGKTAKILSGIGSVVAVIVAVVVVRVVIPTLLDSPSDSPTHTQPSGVYATSEGEAAPTAPFEDTPAAQYPVGEAGITLPKAKAVKGFTKAEVEAGLKKVKQAMIAARLDPTMLIDHDSSKLVKMLAPDARDGMTEAFDTKDFFVYATQIAPGQQLANDPVRVSGRVTFRATTQDDIRFLEVITNFVWVYPFAGELKEPGDHLVVVHDELSWGVPVDEDVLKSSRGLWILSANGFASNMDCDLLDDSLLGLGTPQLLAPGQSQDEDAPFDPNGTLDIEDTC